MIKSRVTRQVQSSTTYSQACQPLASINNVRTVRCSFSDHNIVCPTIQTKCAPPQATTKNVIDYELLREIVSSNIETVPDEGDNPNVQFDILQRLLTDATTDATTMKEFRQKKIKQCEWLRVRPNMQIIIRQKHNLWCKHKREIRNKTCNPAILARLKELGDRLRKMKHMAKEKYYSDLFNSCSDSKETWKKINGIIATKN